MKSIRRLTNRNNFSALLPKGEGVRALRRVTFYPVLVLIYAYFIPATASVNLNLVYTLTGVYFFAGLVILCALGFSFGRSAVLRLTGLAIDVMMVSSLMVTMGEYGVVFIGFYMWICLDYVLCYGRSFYWLALSASLPGLLLLLNIDFYWKSHPQIGIGLLMTILYLPVCTNRLFCYLRETNSAAENANRVKSKFLATISHEIRTPLNVIVGLTELLKQSRLTSEQSDWVRTLGICEEMLLSLINNVLDLAKIEAGAIMLQPKRFLLSKLLENLTDLFRNWAQAKGLHLSFDLTTPDVEGLIGDSGYLNQVLINLIANSIKFTESGTVLIRISEISRGRDKVELLWEIIDTGIGIPPNELGRIFDAFSQVDANDHSCAGGTGLGTAISKELVERMGGKIGVESELGKGSTFWFRLEFGITPDERMSAVSRILPEALSPGMLAPVSTQAIFRILLIEDNPANRSVVTKILQGLGHTVCAMASGEAALVCLACAQFDIVLLDMVLPRLSGVEILHCITRLDSHWQPPVFVLTANAMSEAKRECEAAGASAFLTKPITSPNLIQALNTVYKRTSASTPFIVESAVDPIRLIEQLSFGGHDFSYIFELATDWCADCVDSMKKLESALAHQNHEQVVYLLHNMEGGALEVGARDITALCRSLRKNIASATDREHAVAIDALNAAYVATRMAFERLAQMTNRRFSSASLPVSPNAFTA